MNTTESKDLNEITEILEELNHAQQDIINLLREQPFNKDLAYGLLYDLRTRLGKLKEQLGTGVPPYTILEQARRILDVNNPGRGRENKWPSLDQNKKD